MRYSDKCVRYIRAIRESKGYSQDYIAERLGISQSSYASLEACKTNLTVDKLIALTQILDIDLHRLIDLIRSDTEGKDSFPITNERYVPLDTRIDQMHKEIDSLRTFVQQISADLVNKTRV